MKIILVMLIFLLTSCATPKTEKQKEDRKKLTIMRTMSCIVIPTLPTCIIPGE
tara:strand:+ start:1778 stop:1936 length:159 start_codon:yes stop_codon:yes gene_type:complete